MDFGTGAMSSLIPKLGKLLIQEYNLKESAKKGIGDLRDELLSMQGALVKVSSVPLDQLDPQVKIWANEVRELSYAIEDSLDSFLMRVEGVEPTKPKIKHLLKKARNKFTKFNARHEIAGDIKNIESQVMKIKERYERYKINDIVANLASTTVDPRLLALYNKVSDLVGIGEPIDELMKVLFEGADTSQKDLKIVSVVGFGGLGKTTLAKALYDKLSKTYECQGFVPVGQNQGAKKVLSDILFELDIDLYRAAERMDERQLINQLQKVLAGKRYFIVIDDLWDIQTWEIIKCAFVDSHPESKIIITTRIVDVATRAGRIYHMKPLSNDNSKLLFYTRICGGEEVSRDNQPDEVINKILKKCGGVPLAIITVASLLVGKPSADWSMVYDAIGFGHEDSEVIQNTRKILSFSYYDLPSNLKTCLLYLSMFPEDYFIEKKSLIWRRVIEGFVPAKVGMGSYELGEIYFSKLVNKSMIRWIEPDELDFTNKQGGCRVHDMVLDLICTMSSDINFVTVYDMEQHNTHLLGKQTNTVRRLALHGRSVEHSSSIEMKQVRSFNAIACGDSKLPLLLSFSVLRVLVIEDCGFLEGHSLEHLGKLVHLRYLGLVKSKVNKLPEGIGHDLKFLQILDVRGGSISELPPSVGELQNLRCLWADKGTSMKGEIGKLTCLEELRLHLVDKCPNFFTDLGKLTNLRVLQFQLSECEETAGNTLAESLCKLHKIQSLIIWGIDFDEVMDCFNEKFYVRFSSLEDLALNSKLNFLFLQSIVIPRMPSWINSLCVPLLSYLWLYVEVVETRGLQALGRLPSLIFLFLRSEEEKCISYTFGSYEFHKLKFLETNIEITIGEGALPMLEALAYSACAGRKDNLVPWNNDSRLPENVCCRLDCANSGRREVKAAKAVLRKAERAHPNAEELYFQIIVWNYTRKAARLIDTLGSILHGLDGPDGEEITADQRELRCMITSLETLLRDDDEPRVGRYGEQELRGFVTKFKSLLHDEAATDEEVDNSDAMDDDDDDKDADTDTEDDTDDGNGRNGDNDDDDNGADDDSEQKEEDDDVATSSGGHMALP
ncbi:hypothetical protein ACQ4PT_048560 [Festuca glaucescens]